MNFKVARKSTNKTKQSFMGILSPEEIERGATRFEAEVKSKEIRLKATKVKNTSHQHSI